MSKKQKNETSAKAPVKLTRAEKKEIQAVIRKYKGDGKPHSAQVSIPYEAMYQDGVCRVTPRTFSKCIEFTDISYQLAQADTKTAIFENLCDLYNYLDASIHVQFSFINRKIDPKQYAKSFEIRAQGDDFDDIRSEYSDILQDQLVNGNNGLMKRKFMTYTIEADSLKMARARLRRIETDLLGYFKSMGASAWGLDAKQRLEVMHSIFHPDGEPFSFDWKWLAPSGLSTKDFIAPSSFRFGNARMFGLGGKYGAVSFLQILSPELSDEMLADFLNTENGIVVNLHVQAIEKAIIENNARLVIIDPIQAYLGADVDMNRANEVRPIFMRLGQVAQRTGCAILLIGHLNKAAGMQSLQRGLGSIDIAAAVRSVMFIGKLKHDPTMRILTHEKSSLAPPGASLAFSLGDEGGFRWVGEYDITADEMLSGIEPQRETKTQQAKDLICALLAGGKQVLSEDIDKAALERGIPGRTVRDAKRELGDALKSKIVEGRKKVFWME